MLSVHSEFLALVAIAGSFLLSLGADVAAQEDRFKREKEEAIRRLTSSAELDADAKAGIEAALPPKASVRASKPRKLLIFEGVKAKVRFPKSTPPNARHATTTAYVLVRLKTVQYRC